MKGLFPPYANKTLDEFQVLNPSQEEALHRIKGYINMIPDMRRTGHGLTILGPTGVGKTYLAEMVLKAAQETVYKEYVPPFDDLDEEEIANLKRRYEKKYTVESIEAGTFIGLHLTTMDKEQESERRSAAHEQIRRIETAHFVLFDDLGREHAGESGWSEHLIYNTIKFRYHRKRPFLITSNLSPDELAGRYTEGLVSVLHEKTDILIMTGNDYRCEKVS